MSGQLFLLQNTLTPISTAASDSTSTAVTDALAQQEETLPIIDLMIDSWPIMVPLLLLSVVAVYIWVERYTAIQKASKIDNNFMQNLKSNISSGNLSEAKKLCEQNNTPIGRMLHKGVSRLGKPLDDISTSIENVSKLEISNMEKNLSILATISGAAPMIGFLGTVLGMMSTFHQMAQGGNSGIKIEDLSSGIMYAMATTVAGLIVGIIAYLGYNLLVSKVDKVVTNMEDKSLEFMDLLNQPAS